MPNDRGCSERVSGDMFFWVYSQAEHEPFDHTRPYVILIQAATQDEAARRGAALNMWYEEPDWDEDGFGHPNTNRYPWGEGAQYGPNPADDDVVYLQNGEFCSWGHVRAALGEDGVRNDAT